MIISHKYKFIYFKTHKTAGTSLEIALSKFCGKNDIITTIDEKDEKIRQHLGITGPQNFYIPFKHYKFEDWINLITKKGRIIYKNHMTATLVKEYTTSQIWDTYYKFCFERNPFDKIISLMFFLTRKLNLSCSISEFISMYGHIARDFEVYTINNNIVVDDIYYYEDLDSSLSRISTKLNLPMEITLEGINAKSTYRKDKRHFLEVLSSEDIHKIKELFFKEFHLIKDYKSKYSL